MNIIETIQKNLGFETLKKIDPNTQETTGAGNPMGNTAIAQAGIPAILVGIYNKLEEIPDINALDSKQPGLIESLFGKLAPTVVQQIDNYSKFKDNHSEQQLEHIAQESIRVVKESIGGNTDEKSVRNFVAKNKPEALLYLPPSLDLGSILKNNNMDDRTAKMEGPVSNLMRNIEKAFNTSDSHS